MALEIEHVLSVEPMLPITPVPDMPPYIAGVVNLRGNITAVVDLAQIYGQIARDSHETDCCILMVSVGGHACGLLTSHTGDVREVSDTEIAPPLSTPAGPQLFRGFIDVDGQLVGVLDADRLSTILMDDTKP
ncbi:MAG: purine-binding chemotaxis protein CheW [Chloroflexi bacterium]|nr:purine-binding chemotaxis protein CheW [Chloroflexota bacterium]